MRILTLIGLNPQLVKSQIEPLLKINRIEQVNIIRDEPGPSMPKVQYIYSPNYLKNNFIGRILSKTILALQTNQKKKHDMVISFYLVPHGLIGLFCAKITSKPICLTLLGTDINIHCKRNLLGKILT